MVVFYNLIKIHHDQTRLYVYILFNFVSIVKLYYVPVFFFISLKWQIIYQSNRIFQMKFKLDDYFLI